MAVKEIITWPSESLLLEAISIDDQISLDDIDVLIEDLLDTMVHINGLGLAAPQIGYDKNICVIDSKKIEEAEGVRVSKGDYLAMINPKIVDGFGELVSVEGCLSIPGELFHVQRAKVIWVDYLDESRNSMSKSFDGLAALIVQHEVDHLNGITLAEKASIERRKEIVANRRHLLST